MSERDARYGQFASPCCEPEPGQLKVDPTRKRCGLPPLVNGINTDLGRPCLYQALITTLMSILPMLKANFVLSIDYGKLKGHGSTQLVRIMGFKCGINVQ